MPKIILASSSPRRKMLLEQLGVEFDIVVSDVDEQIPEGVSPEETVKSLAYQKAISILGQVGKDSLVIGADTIVVIDNEVLGKPKDENEIYEMLRKLSGKIHKVMTGICMINASDNNCFLECDISDIKVREISDDEIAKYIKSGEPFDKAGSYAIQGLGAVFVEKIEGSYTGIVGLPIYIVDKMLKYFGIDVLGGNSIRS